MKTNHEERQLNRQEAIELFTNQKLQNEQKIKELRDQRRDLEKRSKAYDKNIAEVVRLQKRNTELSKTIEQLKKEINADERELIEYR